MVNSKDLYVAQKALDKAYYMLDIAVNYVSNDCVSILIKSNFDDCYNILYYFEGDCIVKVEGQVVGDTLEEEYVNFMSKVLLGYI